MKAPSLERLLFLVSPALIGGNDDGNYDCDEGNYEGFLFLGDVFLGIKRLQ